jgi:hypothetical protein
MKPSTLITFFLFSITALLISCSKDNSNPPISDQKILLVQKHVWLMDSANTITSDYNVMQQDSLKQLYTFKTDILTIAVLSITYDLKIAYEAPNKVYYWFPNETKDNNAFMTIENVNEKNLVTKETNSGMTRIRYFHSL